MRPAEPPSIAGVKPAQRGVMAPYRDRGPVPTFGSLARSGDPDWVWLVCHKCIRFVAARYVDLVAVLGRQTSTDVFRRRGRCIRCEALGAGLQTPSWTGRQTGWAAFPDDPANIWDPPEQDPWHMCNEYERFARWDEYCRMMEGLELEVPRHQTELDLPAGDNIRISDLAPVMRSAGGNVVELASMSFGFPPKGKSGPVFNFRSEGRSFEKSKRCLIPASAFFEFTGKKYPKTKHRFTLKGESFMAIAGLWREGQGNRAPSFSMLTTEPGPDVAPIHIRQIVVLKPQDWRAWLDLSKPEDELLKPLPAGALDVETVRQGRA